MEREEMIQILEEMIRDPETNPTARVTAIRALKEFPKPPVVDMSLYDPADVLPMTGPVARRANQRRQTEE